MKFVTKKEDIITLHTVNIKTKIGQDKFISNEIIMVECDIFDFLGWDIIFICTYDKSKIYLSYLYVNNKDKINNLKMWIICYDTIIISIFRCKLFCLNKPFLKYYAFSIIIASFDILIRNYKKVDKLKISLENKSKCPIDNAIKYN